MGRDPIAIGAILVGALQQIVSRNMDPTHPAVLSVTRFQSGSAYNVIPESALLSGTVRFFDDADAAMIDGRMRTLCAGLAAAQEVEIAVDLPQPAPSAPRPRGSCSGTSCPTASRPSSSRCRWTWASRS
jgi:metal-dependent amidase/aminoacylase/carboxypeptidase family protein